VLLVVSCGDAQHHETTGLVLVTDLNQFRHFQTTRPTPRRPNIQDYYFVRIVREFQRFAVDGLHRSLTQPNRERNYCEWSRSRRRISRTISRWSGGGGGFDISIRTPTGNCIADHQYADNQSDSHAAGCPKGTLLGLRRLHLGGL